MFEVSSYSKHWPHVFPSTVPASSTAAGSPSSPGSRRIVDRYPGRLLRGLIHSDGCRVTNRIRHPKKTYTYPRYFFSNKSLDIQRIFCDACDQLADLLAPGRALEYLGGPQRGGRDSGPPRRAQALSRNRLAEGMRIHHLNCGTSCPHGARLLNGEGGWLEPARMVCHCLLIEATTAWSWSTPASGSRTPATRGQLGPSAKLMRPRPSIEEDGADPGRGARLRRRRRPAHRHHPPRPRPLRRPARLPRRRGPRLRAGAARRR